MRIQAQKNENYVYIKDFYMDRKTFITFIRAYDSFAKIRKALGSITNFDDFGGVFKVQDEIERFILENSSPALTTWTDGNVFPEAYDILDEESLTSEEKAEKLLGRV